MMGYKFFRKSLLCYGALVLTMGGNMAYATSLPSSADPSRELKTPELKIPEFKKVEPASEPTQKSVVNAPVGAENAFFTFQSLKLEGMTAYSDQEMAAMYYKDIGQRISVYRVFEIMNEVQARYLKDGYVLTRVTMPDQDIADGNVVFTIIEGYAAEVELDENFPKSTVLTDAAAQIGAMKPFNTKKLEQILLILNDLPDLNASAVLAGLKGPQIMGGVRVILKKNDEKRWSGTIGVNNHGSRFSGPGQMVASGRIASVFTPFDYVSAVISAASQVDEMRYVGVKYERPILGARGLNLALEGSTGRTAPGDSLDPLDIRGQSQAAKVALNWSAIRQRDQSLALRTSFEARNSKTDFLSTQLYDDRLRIFSIGATYNAADTWNGLNAFELTYSQGFNIFGVREAGSTDLSRIEGRPDFRKLYGSIGRLQALPLQLELLGLVQGQYSYDPLLASEEFGFGGGQMGRGYDPSEITGDKGLAASLELRRNFQAGSAFALQPYGFFDIGKVWNIDPTSKNKISAASAGVGLRVGTAYGWSGDVNMAVPLSRDADNPPKYANGQSPRFLVSIQKSF